MKKCINRKCKQFIPDTSSFCPYCGESQAAKRKMQGYLLFLGMALLILIVLIFSSQSTWKTKLANTPVAKDVQSELPISDLSKINSENIQPTFTISPSTTPKPTITLTLTSRCSDSRSTVLKIGYYGTIKVKNVELLEKPAFPDTLDYLVIRRLLMREHFWVKDGPRCFDNVTWWLIKTESSDLGWSRDYDLNRTNR
ncbi:MAG TPA: hypothetical protein VGK00_10025 [Anaerolineales bacterium]|jgi:hypothetical protein